MQRKASKSTRAPNAAEKKFCAWIKEQPCITCNRPPISIADHIHGSSFKLKYNFETVLVGPWLLIPLCVPCDTAKTLGSHKAFERRFGRKQIDYWLELIQRYPDVPDNVVDAVQGRLLVA